MFINTKMATCSRTLPSAFVYLGNYLKIWLQGPTQLGTQLKYILKLWQM